MHTQRFRSAVGILTLLAVYIIAGRFGLSLAVLNSSASAVWPPTGIAMAALLIWGYRLWPVILIGAFTVNVLTPAPAGTLWALTMAKTCGIAIGNTFEALIGAWLIRRYADGVEVFSRVANVFKFAAVTLLSTMASATLGVTSLCVTAHAPWDDFSAVWFTWWLGNFVGALLVTPPFVIWITQQAERDASRAQLLESTGLLLAILLLGYALFLERVRSLAINHLEYLALLPLLWAALRFGPHGAVTSVLIMSAIALWGTHHGVGPFVAGDPNLSLLLLQAFLGVMSLTGLSVAAVISERRRFERRLQVQDGVSRVLAQAPTLKEAAPQIIRTLCETGPMGPGRDLESGPRGEPTGLRRLVEGQFVACAGV